MEIPDSLRAFKRTAYKPQTSDGDGPPTASKFGGTPWLAPGEDWPECEVCGSPLQLFVQLNLDDLPGQYGSGLLQFFYCTYADGDSICEVEREGWDAFSPGSLVRIVQPVGQSGAVQIPRFDPPFPPRRITGWTALDDYPNWEEGEFDLGIVLSLDVWDELIADGFPQSGDKLGGWPLWIQGVEYPLCPDCGEPMRLVFQVDSEDHVPYMWGDVGCGHITQCARHPHRLAFGWACS
jgi:hypothetical protein